jgi:hypothetical protein
MALKDGPIRTTVAMVVAGVVVVGSPLYLYDSALFARIVEWVALAIGLIGIWLFLEWFGEIVFSARFFSRMSSGARIVIGVPVLIGIVAVGWALLWGLAISIKWVTNAI